MYLSVDAILDSYLVVENVYVMVIFSRLFATPSFLLSIVRVYHIWYIYTYYLYTQVRICYKRNEDGSPNMLTSTYQVCQHT